MQRSTPRHESNWFRHAAAVERGDYPDNVVVFPKFAVTFFPDQSAQSKRERRLTLDELGELIRTTNKRNKAGLPWLKLATFGDERSSKNCLRHNENVLAITGIELDYDAEQLTLDAAIAVVTKARLQALLYTSASYSDEAPRWRIVLPTSKPLLPDERTKLVARVNGLFGGVFSPESFTLSQSYYFGAVKHNPAHQVEVIAGDFIDLREDLDASAIHKKGGNGAGEHVDADSLFSKYAREVDEAPWPKVVAAVWAIPNDDKIDRAKWIDIGMAIKSRNHEEGLALYCAWSKTWTGGDYHEQYTIAKYKSFKPHSISARTLFWLADQASPAWRETYQQKNASETSKATAGSNIVIVRAADVPMRAKEWLWEGHLLRGALELTTGLPGLGKSQVQIHFMACATTPLVWPNGAPAIEPVNVITVTAEDALDTEVVPRLTAAGADLNRVHIIKCIKTDKQQRQFLLAEDLNKLEQAIKQIGDVGLICIDPITAYLGGKLDSHKATEVRSQLGPLKDFAEYNNVVVSAITHPAKNAGARAIDHFIGSQAFIAAARIGHVCFEEIEVDEQTKEKIATGRFLFTNPKCSAHVKMPTLAYKIEGTTIYPKPFMQIETSRVVWEKETVNVSADQAIATARNSAKATTAKGVDEISNELISMLRTMLAEGWCKQIEIAAQAKALGYSDKELRTARNHLRIEARRVNGLGKDGWWELGLPPR